MARKSKLTEGFLLPAAIAGLTEGTIQSFASRLPLVGRFGTDVSEIAIGYAMNRFGSGMVKKIGKMYMLLGVARLTSRFGGGILGGIAGGNGSGQALRATVV